MKVADFSVKNSLFVNLMSVVIVIAGVVTYISMRKEAFPPVAYDMVVVATNFRGASSEEVERLVTIPLEREIKEVDSVEEIMSSSDEGLSSIVIQLSDRTSDKDKVISDIKDAVDRVTDLPDDVDERPFVYEVEMKNVPVISVSLSGTLGEFELRKEAEKLKDQLEELSGVASVERSGWRDEEYWVEPDITKMADYHISLEELTRALGVQNVNMPGGKQEYGGFEYNVKVDAELRTINDIKNTVIRSNDLGKWIRISDVAQVRRELADEVTMTKSMGTRAINLVVIKTESGDIIKVVDSVYEVLEEFKKEAPAEITARTFYDMSYYVKRRLKVLKANGLIGFIFVTLVLFIFLPPVSAIMTAAGIPIAFFTTFCIMNMMGLTVNLLTMFGLIMVLGIIVDDGIIISENTYRHIEKGLSPRKAAIRGTNEVAAPVLATILTTVVAFAPLMFMSGILGKFVKYIPMVVIIALMASLIEAYFILPSHLADFARPFKKGSHHVVFDKFRDAYVVLLEKVLRARYLVVGFVLMLFVASVIVAKVFVGFELFGAEGLEFFSVQIETQTGATLERTNNLISRVEKLIAELPERYLDAYVTTVGNLTDVRGDDPTKDKRGSNYAQVSVYLTAANKRDKSAQDIVAEMRKKADLLQQELKSEGLEKVNFVLPSAGPPTGADIDIAVKGESTDVITEIVADIKSYLSKIDGVSDIDDTYQLGSEEINISIDEEKAQAAYLTNNQIAFSVRAALSGAVATTIKPRKADKEIQVLVRLPKSQRNLDNIFDELMVENSRGQLVYLNKVITISKDTSIRSIKHIDGKKVISLVASVDKTITSTLDVNQQLIKYVRKFSDQYPGYSITFRGEQKETMKSMFSLLVAFGIASLLIFVILATLFNSLVQPFIVMAPIPFAFIGVVIAFVMHGKTLGFLSVLGYIGLEGVVVNDSIVLVDFVNKHLHGRTLFHAVIEAGRTRLRPVLITTLTTCVGLATVAYGIGGSDPILKPMALAMCWGLFFATFLTLLVIPCLYLVVDDIHRKCTGKSIAIPKDAFI